LLSESPATVEVMQFRVARYKLFGVVPGATLHIRGAAPGSEVSATVPIETNIGRAFLWTTRGVAGPSGDAAIRVPYVSGRNGMVLAGRYAVSDGKRKREFSVSEPQVVRGETISVDLSR
jgi:hypothetical protein